MTQEKRRKWPMEMRLEVATKLLAGLVSNPAVIAHNDRLGWSIVNCAEDDLAEYAVRLADDLIDAAHDTEPV